MKNTLISLALFFLTAVFPLAGHSQEMGPGFQLLETGEFEQATIFFKDILNQYPTNKTALICYGRALGLSGEAADALQIFDGLAVKYPGDQEVLLNKAEAHLWLKEPQFALATYSEILEQDDRSFNALLGTANSLSMDMKYAEAHAMVMRAVEVDSTNKQALLSQKFIRLAYANQLASEHQKFEEALTLIGLNLKNNPNDKESLLLKANIHIMSGDYNQANIVYSSVANDVDRLLGLSVSDHLLKNDENALNYASQAFAIDAPNERIRINTHYISALLWNKKLAKARTMVDSLVIVNPKIREYVASQAETAMYEADFIKGYETYQQYLIENPDSFKGNLGLADASHALGIDDQAYRYANNTLKYYPGQQDAKSFIQKLNDQHSPTLSGTVVFGRSSDGSSFGGWSAKASTSLSPRVSIAAEYNEQTFNSPQETAASFSQALTFSSKSQIGKRVKMYASISSIKLQLNETPATRLNSDFLLSGRVSKTQTVSLGFKSEVQDFNSDLLLQNLKTSHFIAKNAMNWKINGLGLYSEYYHSFFSDGNKRDLLFTSLYKSYETRSLKFGINYLVMAFKEDRSNQYFSPNSFHQFEVFGDASIKHQSIPLALNMNAAVGYQLIDGANQISWRMKASIEKNAGRLKMSVFGAYSSIVATQTNGFSFFNCGATLKWRITQNPLFKTK